MTFGVSVATLATVVAAGATTAGFIDGMVSGPSGATAGGAGGTAPNVYVPPSGDLATQNTNFNNWQNSLVSGNPWTNGGQQQYSDLTSQLMNSPYAKGYQNSAGAAGNVASWLGNVGASGANSLQNYGAGNMNLAQYLSNSAQSNPYAAQAQYGAGMAGQLLQASGEQQIADASGLNPAAQQLAAMNGQNAARLTPYAGNVNMQLQGLANPLGAAGNSILQTAFDPQSQLYNQSFQQNQDTTNANLARAGLGGSAAGVGVMNQSDQQFNTNWQNQQLARQAQGLSSYGAAAGQAGNLLNSGLTNLESAATTAGNLGSQGLSAQIGSQEATQGLQNTAIQSYLAGAQLPSNQYYSNLGQELNLTSGASDLATSAGNQYGLAGQLGSGAVNSYLAGGQLPYGTNQSILGNQLSALQGYQGAYTTGMQPYQTGISNALQYMGYGSNAGSNLASAAQGSWAQGNLAQQQMYQGLAGLGNQAAKWIGGSGGGSLFGNTGNGAANNGLNYANGGDFWGG